MIKDFKIRAKELPYKVKSNIIKSFIGRENEFHKDLKVLLENIYKDAYVEILQGSEEKGKDLVVRKKNDFGEYEHIAFVVKALEKLSGSANGKTAELVIQIQQAFKTKAQLKDIYDEISISKVYVVNTGTISDGAKRKILSLIDENVYKNNLHYFAIEDLIRLFEGNYPEFYFNRDLQIFFKNRVEKIEKFLVYEKKLQNFIDPNIKKFSKTKKDLLAQSNNSQNELKLIGEQLFGQKETFHSFLKLVTENKSERILLTGDAGSGKSVLLYKLVLEFINNFLKEQNIKTINDTNFQLPVCLKAADIKKDGFNNIEHIIETFYSSSKDNKIKTIIVDGIDEVNTNDRIEIKEKIEAYVKLKNPQISLVFSSRTNFSIIDEFEQYTHYELIPYEMKQAIEFVKKIAQQESILLDNLESKLTELEGQIPFYPLALKLLIEVVEKHKEVPASISELYNKYIGIIFGEFDITTEIDKLFEPKIKREFLTDLSYEAFYLHDKVKIEYTEFDSFITKFCNKHTFLNENKNEFIENIKRISLFKIENNEVYFSHKSFLDFFIANYFKENKDDLLENNKFDELFEIFTSNEQWEDITFFYFGLKTKVNKSEFNKLKEYIKRLEEGLNKNLTSFYLGRLIQYAYMTEKSFIDEIISSAMKLSLDLKNDFHKLFKDNLGGIEIPHILSDIGILHMIDFCYSSSFLKENTKNLIERIDENESEIYFSTIYILKNAKLLEKDFINKNLENILPKIKKIESLENQVLLTTLIDFFQQKGKLELDDKLNKEIDDLIFKYRKNYPDLFRKLFTMKRNNILNLQNFGKNK
ncbi:MAG: hypothetical protein WCR69_02815 [Sulfuricurvum sp.]